MSNQERFFGNADNVLTGFMVGGLVFIVLVLCAVI